MALEERIEQELKQLRDEVRQGLHPLDADRVIERDADAAAKASDRLLDYIESFTRKTIEA